MSAEVTMRLSTLMLFVSLLVGCGLGNGGLFSASSGAGGASGSSVVASSNASSATAESSSDASGTSGAGGAGQSSASATSSSSGGLFWASGVQLDLPVASLSGWTLCWSDLYADTTTSEAQVLTACPGNKLLLACRPTGDASLAVAAMGERADVTFAFDIADHSGTHQGNGVGWYMSPNNWGFAPAGDIVWKGPMDVVGISPNAPGPDGDRRLSWIGNNGQLWVGYRCGYDCAQNHPGFDYKYERAVFSAQ